MMMQVFSVFDSKIKGYLQPFFSFNAGHALRSFITEVDRPDSMMNRHPEDYTLFHIGEFDGSTAKFVSLATPVSLGLALEFFSKIPSVVAPVAAPVEPVVLKGGRG